MPQNAVKKAPRPHITGSQAQQVLDALTDVLPDGVGLAIGYSYVRLSFASQKAYEKFLGWVEADDDLAVEKWHPTLERRKDVSAVRYYVEAHLPWKAAVLLATPLRRLRQE